jgi:hypothetical protein
MLLNNFMLSVPARIVNIGTTSLLLVLTNCVPLAGVLLFGWNSFETVFLYWMESAIIALATITLVALMPIPATLREGVPINAKLIAIPFFILHFGIFMMVHLFLITLFLGQSDQVSLLRAAFVILRANPSIGWAVLSLFISHAYSFYFNQILTKKYLQPLDKESFWTIMIRPYKRIVLMQLTILIGAFAVLLFHLPQPMIAVFVAIKIFFDLRAHKKEQEGEINTSLPEMAGASPDDL